MYNSVVFIELQNYTTTSRIQNIPIVPKTNLLPFVLIYIPTTNSREPQIFLSLLLF